MPADRGAYAERQAALLRSLVAGEGFPDGFAAGKAAAASRSLRRKRAGAVRKAWPALAIALGAHFEERFDAFARGVAAPAFGDGLADGLAFARSLVGAELSEEARVEALFARAGLAHAGGGLRRRRGPFLGAIKLSEPRRLLVVARVPGAGTRSLVLRRGRG